MDDGIAPLHEGDFFARHYRGGVIVLHQYPMEEGDFSLAEVCVFLVQRVFLLPGLCRSVAEHDQTQVLGADGHVPGCDGVDHLFVLGPDDGPVHVHGVLGRPLFQHELLQGLHQQSPPQNPLHCGEPGVEPALHHSGVHQLLQTTLTEQGVHEVQSGKVTDLHLAKLQRTDHPVVHGVPVVVLTGTQAVGHSFQRVNYRTGEVVGRVHLEAGARVQVRHLAVAVEDWVSHALVLVLHVDLATHTVVLSTTLHELRPDLQVLLY